jgi:succinate dehydrogenase / fumarate reductase cytochrome b subunit
LRAWCGDEKMNGKGAFMADVNRGNRPLSPHVSIYRLPLNANLSILHRITGVALFGSLAVVVWWFLAAATSEEYFNTVNGLATSWLGCGTTSSMA